LLSVFIAVTALLLKTSRIKMPSAKEEHKSIVDPATGEFKRPAAQFRNFISSDRGSQFPPEKGRYHLYVSYACPWGRLRPEFLQDRAIHTQPQLTEL
jgi:hypothetical protein